MCSGVRQEESVLPRNSPSVSNVEDEDEEGAAGDQDMIHEHRQTKRCKKYKLQDDDTQI